MVDALSEVVGDEESGKTRSQLPAEYDDLFGGVGGDRATDWTRTTADYPRV